MRNHQAYLIIVLLINSFLCAHIQAQTTIDKIDDHWVLTVDGNPFEIKGVTFGYDDVENYRHHFKELKFLGVNTIRIWAPNENTEQLLNVAHEYDIKVMVGIWMRHGRPGMEDDDSFNYLTDTTGMTAMYSNALATVEKYKDHPAVLMWAVGNEVYLNMATNVEKRAYSELLERICRDIKMVDLSHPITSVEAWTFGMDLWSELVPSVDIYGLNSYGPGANFLASEMEKRGIDKPYIVTEFGVTGEWDIKSTDNGIKVEPTDRQKYDAIVDGYHNWIKPYPNCLGVYVFHYASGTNFISPWLFTHHDKMTRPQYWAVREAYTGKKPVNNIPVIEAFQLTDDDTNSETWIPVTLEVSNVEEEQLDVSFHYNQRTGSRKRRDQINKLSFQGNLTKGFKVKLPNENGPIKVYAFVNDTYGNLGIATTSIVVIDDDAKNRKYLVPKVDLPFYIYSNGSDPMPYIPSGYMGNYQAIDVDLNCEEEIYSGTSSVKISYKARDDWYGVGFVDPANDWGDILGGYDISGAKKFSFWAKVDDGKLKATIGFGLIENDKPYPDTGKRSNEIVLTEEWKKYSIKTKKLDLSCIRSGLVLFSNGTGFPHAIYLDNVVFE
ncbi:MAG: hypothetical protein GY751_02995 [Bacteroidetes bacterium]|nr:hypothetical protein [Bacteroidota bacterium]